MKEYKTIGLMSGTSLDGVDIAYCVFQKKSGLWKYKILHAETIQYNYQWKNRLANLHKSDAETFVKTHTQLGKYFGELINKFIKKYKIKPDLISSHGHTVFHQPENGFTSQIGDGTQIAAITGIKTVCDFRSRDLALKGQGAPLVPVGDRLLFSEYDYCLNLGGIANISFEKRKQRIAFDICPVNMALNDLANEAGFDFDNKGKLSSKGKINSKLLEKLNTLEFYRIPPPKSLGKEWYEHNFKTVLKKSKIKLPDRLRTVTEHIAKQISSVVNNQSGSKNITAKKILVTGGGAHNDFLIQCIAEKTRAQVIIPLKKIIDFKEALVFAFLGVLRMNNEINILKSVTGAMHDHSGGAIYSES
ncbi:MAG: anhydro-N-acetylmuramic acid kinase [Bacteroidia bacterium]